MNRKFKKFFKTHEGCIIVEGKYGAAIYDLISGDVYSLDKNKGEILLKVDTQNLSIDDALIEYPEEEKKEIFQVIKKLQIWGIGKFYKKNTYIPKFKLYMEKELLENMGTIELEVLDCEISQDCNLNCIHCKEGKIITCNGCRINYNLKNSLTLEEWKNVIEEAALFKCKKIRFIGGEPFLKRNELLELTNLAHELNYPHIEIVSNATIIDEKIITNLRTIKNLSLTVPIYSSYSNIHDSITMNKNSFQKTIGNIIKMIEASININIYLLILRQNQDSVEETIKFFHKLGIHCIIEIPKPIDNNAKEYFFPVKFSNRVYKYKPFFDNVNIFKFFFSKYWSPCWGFKVAITNAGDIIPCLRARDETAGNVTNASLRELLIHGKMMKYWDLSKEKIEGCKECEFRYACDDCRILAKALGETIYSKYPYCKYPNWRD